MCHTHESHIWMSHTYEWGVAHERGMLTTCMSDMAHMNESCHADTGAILVESRVTHTQELGLDDTWIRQVSSRPSHMCDTCKYWKKETPRSVAMSNTWEYWNKIRTGMSDAFRWHAYFTHTQECGKSENELETQSCVTHENTERILKELKTLSCSMCDIWEDWKSILNTAMREACFAQIFLKNISRKNIHQKYVTYM